MAYRVSLSVPAEADAYAAFERICAAALLHAMRVLRIWHASRDAIAAYDVDE
jgi:hypothetical protein